VPQEVKNRRFQVLYELNRRHAAELNQNFVGTQLVVLIEKVRGAIAPYYTVTIIVLVVHITQTCLFCGCFQDSKRSSEWFQGRTDGNVKVNFPKPVNMDLAPGHYCMVDITESNSQGLKGRPLRRTNIAGSSIVNECNQDDVSHVQ
jgi:tRNA A37 methylthiotransferase MiaB